MSTSFPDVHPVVRCNQGMDLPNLPSTVPSVSLFSCDLVPRTKTYVCPERLSLDINISPLSLTVQAHAHARARARIVTCVTFKTVEVRCEGRVLHGHFDLFILLSSRPRRRTRRCGESMRVTRTIARVDFTVARREILTWERKKSCRARYNRLTLLICLLRIVVSNDDSKCVIKRK